MSDTQNNPYMFLYSRMVPARKTQPEINPAVHKLTHPCCTHQISALFQPALQRWLFWDQLGSKSKQPQKQLCTKYNVEKSQEIHARLLLCIWADPKVSSDSPRHLLLSLSFRKHFHAAKASQSQSIPGCSHSCSNHCCLSQLSAVPSCS